MKNKLSIGNMLGAEIFMMRCALKVPLNALVIMRKELSKMREEADLVLDEQSGVNEGNIDSERI